MNTIIIKKTFQDDYITRQAGEKLRHLIIAALENKSKLELDFSDLTIASTSFFDEGIAKLSLEGWDKSQFDKYIQVINLDKRDRLVLDKICKERSFV